MEEFDIETLNFDEYNREIYLDENLPKSKERKFSGNSQSADLQKRYKSEINEFVSEYERKFAKNEFDEVNLGHKKKRKI